MSRVARAAVRLKSDIEALFPKAEVEVVGEVDGLGVRRSLSVDKKTAEKLTAEVLRLADDGRIASVEVADDGALTVNVTGGPRGEYRDGFPLRAALEVAEAEATASSPSETSTPSSAGQRKPGSRSRSAGQAGQRKSPRKARTD